MTKLTSALVAILILPSISATEIRQGRKFDIIANAEGHGEAQVTRMETQCLRNRHSRHFTQEEWDNHPRRTCYYFQITNATIRYNDTGEEVAGFNFVTDPVMNHNLTAVIPETFPNNDCVQAVGDILERTANGQEAYRFPDDYGHRELRGDPIEYFSIPQFTARVENGQTIISSARNNFIGSRRQSFSYRKPYETLPGFGIPEAPVGVETNSDGNVIDSCNPSMYSQEELVTINNQVFDTVDPDDNIVDQGLTHIENGGRGAARLWQRFTIGAGNLLNGRTASE